MRYLGRRYFFPSTNVNLLFDIYTHRIRNIERSDRRQRFTLARDINKVSTKSALISRYMTLPLVLFLPSEKLFESDCHRKGFRLTYYRCARRVLTRLLMASTTIYRAFVVRIKSKDIIPGSWLNVICPTTRCAGYQDPPQCYRYHDQ